MTVKPINGQRARLRDVTLDFGFGHARVMLERERRDRLALLRPTADAGEADDRADIGTPARELVRLGGGVERLALRCGQC